MILAVRAARYRYPNGGTGKWFCRFAWTTFRHSNLNADWYLTEISVAILEGR